MAAFGSFLLDQISHFEVTNKYFTHSITLYYKKKRWGIFTKKLTINYDYSYKDNSTTGKIEFHNDITFLNEYFLNQIERAMYKLKMLNRRPELTFKEYEFYNANTCLNQFITEFSLKTEAPLIYDQADNELSIGHLIDLSTYTDKEKDELWDAYQNVLEAAGTYDSYVNVLVNIRNNLKEL